MKSTGVIRKMDELGRVVLPVELRKELDLREGSPIAIYVEDENIILKKHKPNCCNCGEFSEDYVKVWGQAMCPKCYEKFKPLIENRD